MCIKQGRAVGVQMLPHFQGIQIYFQTLNSWVQLAMWPLAAVSSQLSMTQGGHEVRLNIPSVFQLLL